MKLRHLFGILLFGVAVVVGAKLWEFGHYPQSLALLFLGGFSCAIGLYGDSP